MRSGSATAQCEDTTFFGEALCAVPVPQGDGFVQDSDKHAAPHRLAAADAVHSGGWRSPPLPSCAAPLPALATPPEQHQQPVPDFNSLAKQVVDGHTPLQYYMDALKAYHEDQAHVRATAEQEFAEVQQGLAQRSEERKQERQEAVRAQEAVTTACGEAVAKAQQLETAKAALLALQQQVERAKMTVAQIQQEMHRAQQHDPLRDAYEEQGRVAEEAEKLRRAQALQREEVRPPVPLRAAVCDGSKKRRTVVLAKPVSTAPSKMQDSACPESESDSDSDSDSNDGVDVILKMTADAEKVAQANAQQKLMALVESTPGLLQTAREGDHKRGRGGGHKRGRGNGSSADDERMACDERTPLTADPPKQKQKKPRKTAEDFEAPVTQSQRDVMNRGPRGSQITQPGSWTFGSDDDCTRLNINSKKDIVHRLAKTIRNGKSGKPMCQRTLEHTANGFVQMLSFANESYYNLKTLNEWYIALKQQNNRNGRSPKQVAVDFVVEHYHPGLDGAPLPPDCAECRFFHHWTTALNHLNNFLCSQA